MERHTGGIRWGWIAAAILVALLLVVSLAIGRGSCQSAADQCVTEPLGGWAAAIVRLAIGGVFIIFALRRATARRKRDPE